MFTPIYLIDLSIRNIEQLRNLPDDQLDNVVSIRVKNPTESDVAIILACRHLQELAIYGELTRNDLP